ncbi:MAG: acyl-CoA dehydrogenase family protein [Geminicoccaceae bacterium]
MDFALPSEIVELARRTRAFIEAEIIPVEADRSAWDAHENIRLDRLAELRAKARGEGLWAPQTPRELGGMGLSRLAMAVMYQEANRSIFGPVVFNAAAPDDGNMMLLAKVATPAQQARWLRPIVEGEVRSAFVMTEPMPGGGSDPSMIRTRARRRAGGWVVEGRKWFITGAGEAQHFILVARTSDDPRRGLSAFLFDRDQPGWEIVRRIPIMGPEEHGGHCELAFTGLEIADESLLMGEGDGLKATQIRLGPARLTHCMRWLGLAQRCLELAQAYVDQRMAFGTRLAERESVQIKLGRTASAIEIGRLLVLKAAWRLDQGERARKEISMAKVQVADTLQLAADTAVQLQGARGYSKDSVAEWIYRYARQARLVDGASEVHEMVIAQLWREQRLEFWR